MADMDIETDSADYSCLHCWTLKRKCSRELPSCSLCIRLKKTCTYEYSKSAVLSRQPPAASPEQCLLFNLLPTALVDHPSIIPARTFLDSESSRPTSINIYPEVPIPQKVLDLLGSKHDMHTAYVRYFSGLHKWLPILSQKEVSEAILNIGPKSNVCLVLLALAMKLVASPLSPEEPALSTLYQETKDFATKVENCGLITTRLVQSTVLLSVYEIGHAIYPAAYLSISRSTRLGTLLGLHNRMQLNFFTKPETWTHREEERRTWWATLLLDGFVLLGISGLPLASPTPHAGELLPCADQSWDDGSIGFNQPLFVQNLPADAEMGSFAATCQSAHLLRAVIRHRDQTGIDDPQLSLSEAYQLHRALYTLNLYLMKLCFVDQVALEDSHFTAFALCCSARFTLYAVYACNEHSPATGPRLPEEITMQQSSIEGLQEAVDGVHSLTQHILRFASVSGQESLSRLSPLFCHCLYQSISECAWLYREEKNLHRAEQLRTMIQALETLGTSWKAVGRYISILKEENALSLPTPDETATPEEIAHHSY
ncbi:hypothetical protein FQN55_002968 [Onygenales sp. PD_40]|nr:hypothetical protein FQN55_002968 [Onygenales sp. PD_40]